MEGKASRYVCELFISDPVLLCFRQWYVLVTTKVETADNRDST